MISKDDLLYFLEVTNTLNLSRASERLGISQPSLSIAMQRLETALATPLLIRYKKGVLLTPAGKQLLNHAKQLLEYWESVESKVLLATQEPQGTFTLGCHSTIALSYFPHFLPALLEKHPKLSLHLKHNISTKILESILDLSIDVGVIVNPIKHPQLIMHKLYEDETACWYSPHQTNMQDIHSGKMTMICDPELLQTQAILKKMNKKGIKYDRILSSSSFEVIAALVADGGGVAILPSSIALHSNKLQKIPQTPTYADEIYLIYRPETRDLKGIQAIVSAIREYFSLKK